MLSITFCFQMLQMKKLLVNFSNFSKMKKKIVWLFNDVYQFFFVLKYTMQNIGTKILQLVQKLNTTLVKLIAFCT